MKPRLLFEIVLVLCTTAVLSIIAGGCTSEATRNAIEYYETSQDHEQTAFDNALRAANQQLFLATAQYIQQSNGDKQALLAGIKAAFVARQNLETMNIQFERARALNRLTVGVYLYDKQGIGNILFEEVSKHLSVVSKSAGAAQASIGKSDTDPILPASIIELITNQSPATSQPASQPATQPAANNGTTRIEELLNEKH